MRAWLVMQMRSVKMNHDFPDKKVRKATLLQIRSVVRESIGWQMAFGSLYSVTDSRTFANFPFWSTTKFLK